MKNPRTPPTVSDSVLDTPRIGNSKARSRRRRDPTRRPPRRQPQGRPVRRPGSLRDLEARLEPPRRFGGAQCWRSGHSRSALQRLFRELPPEYVDEIRALMMLPGYAELLPSIPREVIEFYLRLPRYARMAIRKVLRGRSIKKSRVLRFVF